MWRLSSLRQRLFVLLAALGAAVSTGVGLATYRSVLADADELFDYHLRQMALGLRDQGTIPDAERAALAGGDFDYVVQVWSLDGLELYSTGPRTVLPPRAVLGFSTLRVDGADWRLFSTATSRRIVQVGQPLAVRRTLAVAAAWRSVIPVAAAAPLVALAIWWLVGTSLAPLQRVVNAARQRDAFTAEPLPTDGLPDEVVPLVQAFNGLLVRLGQALEGQRAFVADAAHELRTPLTALKLQLATLAHAGDTADRAQAQQRLKAGVDRAARLVEQLLTLARAEPGSPEPMHELDLATVVRQVVAQLEPVAQAAGARVHLQLPHALPMRGDSQALASLVRNLVDNALRHGGPSGQVTVRLLDEPTGVVLQVDDHGPGVPAAERERVFDRFHRRDPGRTEGSGLGLAIVRAIAGRHGGLAALHEAPGGGTRAEVRLPPSAGRPS